MAIPAGRWVDGDQLEVRFPPAVRAACPPPTRASQATTVEELHRLQSFRSVVERVFGSMTQWKVLKGDTLLGAEMLETWTTIVMALYNVSYLFTNNRENDLQEPPRQGRTDPIIRPKGNPSFRPPPESTFKALSKYPHVHKVLAALPPLKRWVAGAGGAGKRSGR